mmetsp:Transcript_8414/g.18446  ORF Transcript_8414/g.18446 Transcript_8414/m.18446 type:complete len:184 (-) Transcript_8414:309-860(-)|eukprot:CAMPEP_0113310050 /NCGR_PEP_ID=MMETSP0010_2-20120614/7847_1 /TAXON_ID=216773 ORGANISM="Corethron hystrix, Strain 308" /NCGR_SAMPLE_ID=MMETSP0010_2 /ASSEMBLY_ACC=CAM_ASM_000155 /LENGTH=183 /DNA_ID=CAMNT_0000165421 /DNA_START=207 /DNA_END=758 /DNA_ORIENTATION=- /assembly_acc=CAM_ASM_000155
MKPTVPKISVHLASFGILLAPCFGVLAYYLKYKNDDDIIRELDKVYPEEIKLAKRNNKEVQKIFSQLISQDPGLTAKVETIIKGSGGEKIIPLSNPEKPWGKDGYENTTATQKNLKRKKGMAGPHKGEMKMDEEDMVNPRTCSSPSFEDVGATDRSVKLAVTASAVVTAALLGIVLSRSSRTQ